MEIDAEKEAKWLEDCRLSAIRRAEEEKVRQEAEARRREEQQKTDTLLQQAELFARAQMIRTFVNEVKRKAISLGEIPGQTQQWIAWAERKADEYDPTVDSMEAPPG